MSGTKVVLEGKKVHHVAQHSRSVRRKTAGFRRRDRAREGFLLRRSELDSALSRRRHRRLAGGTPRADFAAFFGSSLSGGKSPARQSDPETNRGESIDFRARAGDAPARGGLLNSSNPPYLFKPSKTIVDTLISLEDPRLQRWAIPVQRKWDYNATSPQGITVTNIFGEFYNVTVVPPSAHDVDTALYVGLPMGLATVDLVTYNDESSSSFTYPPERSPYISFLHPRYYQNNETYLKMDLMTYNEVEFLLAEAAQATGFSVTDAEQHYKNGIIASLKRWGITDGANGFNFSDYYSNPEVSYSSVSNKLERIMEQKWIAGWLTIEPWFDWRRTGFPQFKTGPVTQYGPAVPIRFMYPSPSQDPKYLVNYNEAVKDLEPTVYVPTGQTADHNYSRIWLLQGTNKPY